MKKLWFALALLGLSGCVTVFGVDFDRSKTNTFVLGQTSKAQVISALGNSGKARTFTVTKDAASKDLPSPVIIDELYYSYTDTQAPGAETDTRPMRSVLLLFVEDKLAYYATNSSFKNDSTEFNEAGAKQLQKGKTSQADVLKLFGPPVGRSIYPFAKEPGGSSWHYQFNVMKQGSFKYSQKSLRIYFDPHGIVSDFALTIESK